MIAPFVFCLGVMAVSQNSDPPSNRPEPKADTFEAPAGWKPLGKNLWFDPEHRRVALRAKITLREGPLEHLLCRKGTKEHEAILATEADPRSIHAALLLTGAEPGHPVKFRPKFEPPAGTPIAIEAEWVQDGKTRRADVKTWVKDERNNKPLTVDWVFAGSEIFEDPITKKPFYAADDGDLFTVANFPAAILDLPFASTDNDADRVFAADPKTIPPRWTFVTLYLSPREPVKTLAPGKKADPKAARP